MANSAKLEETIRAEAKRLGFVACGFTRADGALYYTIAPWARAQLNVENLFDTDYKQVAFDALLQGSGTRRGTERGLTEGFYNRSTQLYGVFLG